MVFSVLTSRRWMASRSVARSARSWSALSQASATSW